MCFTSVLRMYYRTLRIWRAGLVVKLFTWVSHGFYAACHTLRTSSVVLVLQLFYIGFTCVLRNPPIFGFKRGLVLQLFYIGSTCVLRNPPFFGFKRGLVLQLFYIGFTCVLRSPPFFGFHAFFRYRCFVLFCHVFCTTCHSSELSGACFTAVLHWFYMCFMEPTILRM